MTELQETVLDVIETAMRVSIGAAAAESLTVEQTADMLGGHIVQAYMRMAGQHFETVSVEHPADWWQAFKARWFTAGWLGPLWLHRHPVMVAVTEWQPSIVYPDIKLPDERRWESMATVRFVIPRA